jgi:hypothetical protein
MAINKHIPRSSCSWNNLYEIICMKLILQFICNFCLRSKDTDIIIIITLWPSSESEVYRPRNRRLSAKLVPSFVDRWCRMVSATDPNGRILGFLHRKRYRYTNFIYYVLVCHSCLLELCHPLRQAWTEHAPEQYDRAATRSQDFMRVIFTSTHGQLNNARATLALKSLLKGITLATKFRNWSQWIHCFWAFPTILDFKC